MTLPAGAHADDYRMVAASTLTAPPVLEIGEVRAGSSDIQAMRRHPSRDRDLGVGSNNERPNEIRDLLQAAANSAASTLDPAAIRVDVRPTAERVVHEPALRQQ